MSSKTNKNTLVLLVFALSIRKVQCVNSNVDIYIKTSKNIERKPQRFHPQTICALIVKIKQQKNRREEASSLVEVQLNSSG